AGSVDHHRRHHASAHHSPARPFPGTRQRERCSLPGKLRRLLKGRRAPGSFVRNQWSNTMSTAPFIASREFFPGIDRIQSEGPESHAALALKAYDAEKIVGGTTMRDHLRSAICYWHTFCADGGDPCGPGTRSYPWKEKRDPMAAAEGKPDAAFEFFTKMG